MERVLAYKARQGLRGGLRRMAYWVKGVGPIKPTPFGEIKVTKNLPPSWRG